MTPEELAERDARFMQGLMRTFQAYQGMDATGVRVASDDVEAAADLHGSRTAIRFEGQGWTYAELDARANRFAHWARAEGWARGDCVALYMTNQPDYLAAWLGLCKAGVTAALVNSNLAHGPLAHSFKIAAARAAIVSPDLAEAYRTAADHLPAPLETWGLGQGHPFRDLETALAAAADTRPPIAWREGVTSSDVALYVYTSGTTGAPKAAKMTHLRVRGI